MPKYPITEQQASEIDSLFSYHAPKEDQAERYELIRSLARGFAVAILENCPPCADQTAALRKIREAVMTASAAIACNE